MKKQLDASSYTTPRGTTAKTLYNRWKRWSDNGVFARIMMGLATESAEHKTIMIDATYLKAHRTASSLRVKKGGVGAKSGARKAA